MERHRFARRRKKEGEKVAKSKVGSWIGKFYTQPEVPVHQNIFLNGQQKKTLPLFSICIPGPSIGQSKHSVLQIIFVWMQNGRLNSQTRPLYFDNFILATGSYSENTSTMTHRFVPDKGDWEFVCSPNYLSN